MTGARYASNAAARSPPAPSGARRVAFINTEDDKNWQDQMQLFQQALDLPTEVTWDEYNIFAGEKPESAALGREYAALVVCGSHFNVDDAYDWLEDLFDLIRLSSELPDVRLLGVCFGCQAVAAALGGSVGPNLCGSYVYRNERVQLAPALQQKLVDSAIVEGSPPVSLNLLATHGNSVLELPDGGEVLAWSEGSPHELFVCGAHNNIVGCQCHPEYTPGLLRVKCSEALRSQGVLSEEAVAKGEASFSRGADSPTINALLSSFLAGSEELLPRP